MRIVFDTNILCSDYWFKGAGFRALSQLIIDSNSSLHLPEVVLDELFVIYEEDLRKDANKVQSYASRLLNTEFELPTCDNSFADQQNYYREYIHGIIDKYSIHIIPYPNVPLKEIVKRELNGMKPFAKRDIHKKNQSKVGSFRDYLIWHSVLALAEQDGPEVVFIANNPDDYSVDKNENRNLLHKDLRAEATELGINESKLKYFPTLSDFVKEVVTPKLISVQTKDGDYLHTGINIKDWIRKTIPTFDMERKVDVYKYGFKHSDDAVGSYVKEIQKIDILDVRKLTQNDLICEVNVYCIIELLVGNNDEIGFEYGNAVISLLLEIQSNKAEVTSYSWEVNPA
tara:strand:- start:5114 stop:6139 length:1026 start_codon:yes stop_codon:yes gene_type:complete